MNTLLIVSTGSGQTLAALARRRLLDHAYESDSFQLALASNLTDVREFAEEACRGDYDRIIVAGGDGTINAAVNGIGDSKIPLGIIPLGTANVLARHLEIPQNDAMAALWAIENGTIKPVDVAVANDTRFLLMAGMGFDAAVVGNVSRAVKNVIGPVAYAPAIVEELVKCTPSVFRIIFDNNEEIETEAFSVVVANCAHYAHDLKIAPDAQIDDGLLDVVIFQTATGASKLKFIGQALETLMQQTVFDLNTINFRTEHIKINVDPAVKLQLDGDVRGETPVDIRILPSALNLIVP